VHGEAWHVDFHAFSPYVTRFLKLITNCTLTWRSLGRLRLARCGYGQLLALLGQNAARRNYHEARSNGYGKNSPENYHSDAAITD
jgi:hypothetical protein